MALPVEAQELETITLGFCYNHIYQNYPTAAKADVQEKITALNRAIIRTGRYPDIQVSGLTSYQSDVTEIPFSAPGTDPLNFSKDHYRISLDLTQPLYDGGRRQALHNLEKQVGLREQATIQTELWAVRNQIDQIYFGILMLKKQHDSIQLMLADLNEQLSLVSAQVRNGLVLPGNELVLKAERIKASQRLTQAEADINVGYQVLSELLGISIPIDTKLEIPTIEGNSSYDLQSINRAEYDLFKTGIQTLNDQKEVTRADRLPVIHAFGTTAYGRPGFNVFEDDLQLNWMVGLRAQWGFRSWSNASKKMELLELEKRKIAADKDAFTRTLEADLRRSEVQINTLRDLITSDEEVLELRQQVVAEKESLLEVGAITSTEYITELNAENRARIELDIRKLSLIQATIELSTKKGAPWE
ncbi:MAG: TolC family protein [Balneolales bacterium]